MTNTHQFETVAFVASQRGQIQLPVVVMYEHNGGRPEVYAIREKADPENELSDLISDHEKAVINYKVATDLRARQVEYADELLQGDR